MTEDHFCLVGEAVKAEPYQYKGCGLDGIFLLNGYHFEEHDGERHVSITNLPGLHQAIGKHLVLHRKALSPKEIRFLRNTMQLTQAELAELLGNTSQSVARWEKDQCAMPGPEEKLLRTIFLARFISDDELQALRELITNRLAELDNIDQMASPRAQFELFDNWQEKVAA